MPLDNPTPEVMIIGAAQDGHDLKVTVAVKNFKMGGECYTPLAANPTEQNPPNYGKVPRKANYGHIHAYLAPYGQVKPTNLLW